ncbi:MAG: flavin reductase family protein [Leadbetterella sp.]
MQDPKKQQVDFPEIQKMDTRYRATFINSLGGFKSLILIGTEDNQGRTNLATFNSLIHIGANPALCAFIVRPDVSPRHTLENILETGIYTINHIHENILKQGHQASARYDKSISEFDATSLQREYIDGIKAPFVEESQVKFACEFRQKIPIELNGTTLIIGEIKHVLFPSNCLHSDGFIDIEKAGTLTVSGLDSYHYTQSLGRLSYAKIDKTPEFILSSPFES